MKSSKTKKPKPHTQSGFVLSEFILSLPTVITIISGVLILSYYTFCFHQISFYVHETALCLDETSKVSSCKLRLEENLKKVLPIGQVHQLKVHLKEDKISVALQFRVFSSLSVNEVQELQRPLLNLEVES